MFTCKDQLGREVILPVYPPKRIISLVPSQTELLFDLGLDREVIGITRFCVHPEKWKTGKEKIGGTKNPDVKKIKTLAPDLVIANKEENSREQLAQLAEFVPVYISEVRTLTDAVDMIEAIGTLTGRHREAGGVISGIRENFTRLQQKKISGILPSRLPKVCYLIWREPFMTVGGDTFIADMLRCCGFQNIFDAKSRYPEVTPAEIQSNNCEVIFLSSEPYPFKEKHIGEIKKLFPDTSFMLVDGTMFSWYGSRLLLAPGYFEKLINRYT